MRPLKDLIPHAEALRRVVDACPPVNETEHVPSTAAVGRVLAEEILSPLDVPNFDRAAMDGYALRSTDAETASDSSPVLFRIIGVRHAGDGGPVRVAPNECVQVATGAPMPPGADCVVMVERTRVDENRVLITKPLHARENVSARGSDLRKGETAGLAGSVLTPARLAVITAAGRADVLVWRRPLVTILSTGAELVPAGRPLGPGAIHDSNGPALEALLASHGVAVDRPPIVPDDVDALRAALRSALARSDLFLVSGGSSAGERDVVRDAVSAEGRIEFHGVRVKPGKPLLLGNVGTRPVIGLPGYPTSCLSDAYLYVLPALRRMAHLPPENPRRLRAYLSERIHPAPGRVWFLPVRLDGVRAIPTYKESGATTSLRDAVGYIEVPPDVEFLDAGDAVDVTLF